MSESRYSFGQVAASWAIEVEYYWRVVSPAKLLVQRIEDLLATLSEATKNENQLRRYGVNNVAYLGTAEQKIDEVGYFQAVDSYCEVAGKRPGIIHA
ncbi:MAG TPA: hypothetical protein VNO50_11020 [Pyrinomonadaceae bacterium]|nr:hypothetical protein [Pyrinomonadaceae bacterium]